jgi:REP element-mobilizing transposase RayT
VARPVRIEYENAVYHITARGNERKDIFVNQKDREKFLHYLCVVHQRYEIIVYCYVLMNNHYHLLIETPQANLSRVMRDLNGHYTIYFNLRHNRAGHLLQGRYKAILVDKDNYLLELSRYIHLNPVRAKVLANPEQYSHSSMHYYIGKETVPDWLNTNFILEQFGRNKREQIKRYKKFVYDGINKQNSPLEDSYAQSILGSAFFIEKIKDTYLRGKNISRETPKLKSLKYGKNLHELAAHVMDYYKIDRAALFRKKAKFNNGKKVFVYLARTYTHNGLRAIKDFLDNSITEVAISKIYNRTQEELVNERALRAEVTMIEQSLFEKGNMYQVKT